MQWLNKIIDEVVAQHPEGEIVVSSGVSPSGKYHLGTLREVLTAEVIMQALRQRGRDSRHIHVVDDLDPFRKVPSGLPAEYEQYLGRPLCDTPAPDGSGRSYADFFLGDLLAGAEKLKLEMEVMRSHEKYREGFFVGAIEKTLTNLEAVRKILEEVSGRKLEENWSPIQIMEEGYLKTRPFVSIDTDAKSIKYLDKDGQQQQIDYRHGDVKLNWRVDWPARWWLLNVSVEPFGRDHATKGGSYDTGAHIVKDVFGVSAPLPVPYDFINRAGETKKMSKSAGDTVTLDELLQLMPAEIVWFFILRYPPEKLLFFDEGMGLVRLFDEFSELLSKPDKTDAEQQLVAMSLRGSTEQVISSIPFSHLVASYQAALRSPDKTLEIIKRTEHADTVTAEEETIKKELVFIDHWLNTKAPEEVKFSLADSVNESEFSDSEKNYLRRLADEVEKAPEGADGEWFHKAIYQFKDTDGLTPQQLFGPLYRALIGKEAGPRAGWFLSTLPRDWLVKRLRLEA
jgi:lysyl-tRNA synthetase class 1